MQNQQPIRHRISVHPPKLHPKISTIGYGNPRYNSMLPYKSGLLLCVGSHLRWTDLKEGTVKFDRQIGYCQIFEVMENQGYILVVNFDGLVTLLEKEGLGQVMQFYAPGKEIRHVTFGEKYLAFSAELVEGTDEGLLLVYSVSGLLQGKYQPLFSLKGRYYFPEYLGDELTVLEYHDPNPKGRKRKQTVLSPKLPITNQILKFDKNFKISFKAPIQQKGQIICCCQNKGIIYYLHTTKRLTLVDVKGQKTAEVAIPTKSFPHVVEPFQNGVVFVCENNKLEYFQYGFEKKEVVGREIIEVRSMGVGGNLALKFSEDGIYSFNESGLHFYCNASKQTVSQSLFSITNCGISFNSTASMFAVADFGGTFFIFNSFSSEIVPLPLFSIFIGIPIRSLAWCGQTNNVVVGSVGGGLYWWVYGSEQAQQILQIDHTFNIIRAVEGKVYAGSSDGTVKIFQSLTMKSIGEYKAHHPIDYESQEERELFGSMKNYAEIWSLTIPVGKAQTFIVSSCEDQSEKVYRADPTTDQYQMIYHLKGHELAVTSVDWKLMDEKVGEIYVSCSDDKLIRFRDPNDHFRILFEVETTTIRQWHTLTYLALEPKGHRVAIGSQNGYLFIFDIEKRELVFGEKVHLGGIQGMDWVGNTLCTCSSDLCVNIMQL